MVFEVCVQIPFSQMNSETYEQLDCSSMITCM